MSTQLSGGNGTISALTHQAAKAEVTADQVTLEKTVEEFLRLTGVKQQQTIAMLHNGVTRSTAATEAWPMTPPDAIVRVLDLREAAQRAQQEGNAKYSELTQAARTSGHPEKYQKESAPELRDAYVALLLIQREAQDLYRRIVTGGQARLGTATQLNFEKTAFENARDYHRKSASRLLWAVVIAALLACMALVYLFYLAEQRNDYQTPGLIIAITGRAAFVLLAGWIVTFLARLHSSHAQQAVFYQDRLAGIDAARNLIEYADTDGRQDMIKQLVQAYTTLERNAFVATTKATSRGLVTRKDLKVVTDLVKAVRDPAVPK
jgi:hypothetical protein